MVNFLLFEESCYWQLLFGNLEVICTPERGNNLEFNIKNYISAKIWLNSFKIEEKESLSEKEINQALILIKSNQKILIDAFNKVKEGKKITTIKLSPLL